MVMVRSFDEEFNEIAEDVQFEIGMLEDTFDEDMRVALIKRFNDATQAGMKTHDPMEALCMAMVAMYTHAFYVGREHALRGYASPRGRTDGASDLSDMIPDTPEGL